MFSLAVRSLGGAALHVEAEPGASASDLREELERASEEEIPSPPNGAFWADVAGLALAVVARLVLRR